MSKFKIKDRRLRDLSYTLGANVVSLISGLLIAFVIPKLLSIEEYAYLRVFTFYLGYVGIFHFGFNDGVYINYGKYDYDNLPREKFRTYFKFLVLFQSAIAVLVFVVSSILSKDNGRIIIYGFLCINIILVNIIGYFDFISQFVRRFKVYSFNVVLSKVLYILGILSVFFINNRSGIYFIILQTFINILVVFIYILRYKDIIFGKGENLSDAKEDIKSNFTTGFLIMVGNFATIIIIGIDRIFVDKFYTVKDFAMYSFAVSLLSMFYLILNAITTVVYPYLTRSNDKNKGKTYETMKSAIFIALGFCISGYFIFDIIVRKFIPQYIDALSITAIIFPTIVLSGEINIVTQNYYKTMKLQKQYTKNNIAAVTIAVITILISVIFFKSLTAIAVSSLVSFFIWELYGDNFFKRNIGCKTARHHIAEILSISLFIYLTLNFKWYIGFIIYLIIFTVIVFVFLKNDIREIIKIARKKETIDE